MTSDLERDLRRLEAEADRAGPGAASHVLNRAGDLCLGSGDRDRALGYYGRAIDASLSARRYNAAAGLCRKLLRVAPGAVRTRCTLAWLALGRGDVEETTQEVGAYVDAALHANQRALTTAHLRRMAATTGVPAIGRMVAGHLERLDRAEEAHAIAAALTEPADTPALTAEQQEQLWRQVVASALLGPDDPVD
jgi:hypothetical protein